MSGRLGEAQAGIKIAGRLIYTSVSLLLSRTQGYCYHLSKFHIYALVYCIDQSYGLCGRVWGDLGEWH